MQYINLSIVNSVLIRPLPYRDAGLPVMLWFRPLKGPGRRLVSPADYAILRERNRAFEDIGADRLEHAVLQLLHPEKQRDEDRGQARVPVRNSLGDGTNLCHKSVVRVFALRYDF